MKARAAIGPALRVIALGSLLTSVLVGGITVALELESQLLAGTEAALAKTSRPAFRSRDGMEFVVLCGGTPTPLFEVFGPVLVPFLLASLLPARRPITLDLSA